MDRHKETVDEAVEIAYGKKTESTRERIKEAIEYLIENEDAIKTEVTGNGQIRWWRYGEKAPYIYKP